MTDSMYYLNADVVDQVAADISKTAKCKLEPCVVGIEDAQKNITESFILLEGGAGTTLDTVISRIANNITVVKTELDTTSSNLVTLANKARSADAAALALQS